MGKKDRRNRPAKQQQRQPTSIAPRQHSVTVQRVSYTGPVPPPEALIAYAQADSTIPNRLVRMAETEQAYRHEVERVELQHVAVALRQEHAWRTRGQWMALCIGGGALCVAAYAVHQHEPWVAGTAITAVAAMVGVFLRQARRGTRNDESADEQSSELARRD